MIGQSIAHYEVTQKLGQGGMGEVYRARDTKLGREVALKVLPDSFTSDTQRLGRFKREAELLASLNHANIAIIHGIEEGEGRSALVLELVEGEDLSERIERGPLLLNEALRIALQVASALEAAHSKGIIHRDLKPANIKLRSDGQVKVLDFGLAKAAEGNAQSSPDLSQSPTLTMAATQAGIILGTAAYMSPEQASGEVVDQRADIWSFGVVLFEMLAGRNLFQGDKLSHILADVIRAEPDWNLLPEDTPQTITRLLRRCLAKDPTRRLQAIGDARLEIEEYLANPTQGEKTAPVAAPPKFKKSLFWAGVGAALLLGALIGWLARPQPQAQPLQVEAIVEGDRPLMTGLGSATVLSEDGSLLAYTTGEWTNPSGQIYLRRTHRFESEILSGTDGGYHPFFSPDARWVGFVTITELKKVAISGGTPLGLCGVNRSRGATWGPDGTIVFAPNPASPLMQISAAGGEPQPLTQLEEGEQSHRWPQFLPGGRRILYSAYKSAQVNNGEIKIHDLDTGRDTVVHRGGTQGRFLSSGHLLYWREGTVFAAPLDLDTLQLTEMPTPVLQQVAGNPDGGAQFDVAANGTLVYLRGDGATGENVERTLVWAEASGELTPATSVTGNYLMGMSLSPDETRLAIGRTADSNLDIWVYDLERDTPTRLTFDDNSDMTPVWSPDGKDIYYASTEHGYPQIYRKPADGSRETERLIESEYPHFPSSITPDGRFLLFAQNHPATAWDLWMAPLDGQGTPQPLLVTPASEDRAMISPNGKWFAYISNESGRNEVYLRPFPGPGGKWQVSSTGTNPSPPHWSGDGKHLFYMNRDTVYRVTVEEQGESVRVSRAEAALAALGSFSTMWEMSKRGERFLLTQNPSGSADGSTGSDVNRVRFVFNWFGELESLLSAGQ